VVAHNHIHHNAEIGLVGYFARADSNEIAYNNTAKFRRDWEGGGTKFFQCNGVLIRGNYVHDNHGTGLWTDFENDNVTISGNTVTANNWMGIHHEISWRATITNNVVTGNGLANPNSAEGGGIQISNSGGTGTTISGNTLVGNKNAVVLMEQNRGSGTQGVFTTRNVSVHDNTITMAGTQRTVVHQYAGDGSIWTTKNNHFEHNTYNLQTAALAPFEWAGANRTDAQWRAYGNDDTGTLNR
jgi:parallel beta-helix repeat protein